jgi:hypothetical protein
LIITKRAPLLYVPEKLTVGWWFEMSKPWMLEVRSSSVEVGMALATPRAVTLETAESFMVSINSGLERFKGKSRF